MFKIISIIFKILNFQTSGRPLGSLITGFSAVSSILSVWEPRKLARNTMPMPRQSFSSLTSRKNNKTGQKWDGLVFVSRSHVNSKLWCKNHLQNLKSNSIDPTPSKSARNASQALGWSPVSLWVPRKTRRCALQIREIFTFRNSADEARFCCKCRRFQLFEFEL